MKVMDLIEELAKLDPMALVVVSGDAEGNEYHKLWSVVPNCIYNDEEYYGEVYDTTLPPEEHCMDEEDWAEALAKYKPCVVLYPC